MDNMEYKNINAQAISFERKAEGEFAGRLLVKLYGATFGNIDSYRDTIQKGAFVSGTEKADWGRVAFCKQHDMSQPIGKIIELKEDDKGLYCEVVISASEEDIAVKIEEGILREFSIGYMTKKATYVTEPKDGEADRILEEIKLYEISVVTRAADANAVIVGAERKEEEIKTFMSSISELKTEELEELKSEINRELYNRLILNLNL